MHFKLNVRALTRLWSLNRTIDHDVSAAARKAAPAGEAFPILAHELGYHSVQVQLNFYRLFAELVRRAAAVAQPEAPRSRTRYVARAYMLRLRSDSARSPLRRCSLEPSITACRRCLSTRRAWARA